MGITLIEKIIMVFGNISNIIIFADIVSILKRKYKLKRTKKFMQIIDKSSITDVEETENIIDNPELDKEILIRDLIQKIHAYVDTKNLVIGHKNLQTLKIKQYKAPLISIIDGQYDPSENEIEYTASSLGHELLHLFSSIYDEEKGVALVGFSQQVDGYYIGSGINEGYTSLLASKIYNDKKSYAREMKIVRLMELFFDNPKQLEDLFFNCDLLGLIHHFEQFIPRDKFIQFILDVDFLKWYHVRIFPLIVPGTSIIYTKLQMQLYNWFCLTNPGEEKMNELKKILFEDKFIALLMNGNGYRLYKETQQQTIGYSKTKLYE